MFLIIRTWTTSALFVFNSSHEWTYFQEFEKLHAWYKFIFFFQLWIISKTFSQALLHFFIGCEKFIWKIPTISTAAASSSPCNHLPLLKCILLPTSFVISATSVKEWVPKARVSGYLQYCRLTVFFQKTLKESSDSMAIIWQKVSIVLVAPNIILANSSYYYPKISLRGPASSLCISYHWPSSSYNTPFCVFWNLECSLNNSIQYICFFKKKVKKKNEMCLWASICGFSPCGNWSFINELTREFHANFGGVIFS